MMKARVMMKVTVMVSSFLVMMTRIAVSPA